MQPDSERLQKHKNISANTNADSDTKDDFQGINVYEHDK